MKKLTVAAFIVLSFVVGMEVANYTSPPPLPTTCATLLIIPKESNWAGPYLPVGELRYCGTDLKVEFK